MPYRLEPTNGGKPVPLDKPVLLMGRHPDCDVRLPDTQKVSRRHCCIAQVNTRWVLRDLGSMNGVMLNGVPLARESEIKAGDRLLVGDQEFIVAVHRQRRG